MNARFAAAGLLVAGLIAGTRASAQQAFIDAYDRAQALQRDAAEPSLVTAAYREALVAFEGLAGDEDGFDDCLAAAGWSAFQVGEVARAAEWLESAIDRVGATPFLVEYRVRALVAAGEHLAALRAARRYVAGFADAVDRVVPLVESAGFALRQGSTEVAMWYFRRRVDTSDRHPIDLGNLALALRSLGLESECEATYREALALAPDDAVLWNDFGLFCKGLARTADAVAAFQRSLALEAPPHDGPAIGNLIDLQRHGIEVGIADPAIAVTKVLRTRPDSDLARRRCIDAILGR